MLKLLVLSTVCGIAMSQQTTLLVTGYNSQAGLYSFENGVVTEISRVDVEPNLTWLEQDPETGSIFATHEVGDFNGETGGVLSRWQFENGNLVMQEYVSLVNVYPAHLKLDRANNLAYTANYGGSAVCVVTLTPEGTLGDLVQTENYDEGCRDASHPHQIVVKGDIVWVVDLGCDVIRHYRVVDGKLESIGSTSVQAGSGPRHMVLHPTKNLAFLACELQSLVEVYSVDFETGELTLLQQLPFASETTNAGAEILISEDGSRVYASSRRVGVIVVYKVNEDNSMERAQEIFLQGTWPRSMVIQDNFLIMAHKIEGFVEVLGIDEDGLLVATDGQPVSTPDQPAFITQVNM